MSVLIPVSPIPCLNFVDEKFKKTNGPSRDVFSPYTDTIIGEFSESLLKTLQSH